MGQPRGAHGVVGHGGPLESERDTDLAAGVTPDPPGWDDWELHDALARARWTAHRSTAWRVDDTHAPSDQPTEPPATKPAASTPGGGLAWLAACLGAAAVTFGGVALGWSLLGSRADLWNIGLLTALAGQLLLVLGLFGYRNHTSPAAKSDAAAPGLEPQRARSLPWTDHGTAVLHSPLPEEPAHAGAHFGNAVVGRSELSPAADTRLR